MELPQFWFGRREFVTPWFGAFWGYCAYRVIDFAISFQWKRRLKVSRHERIFQHGISIGWDWLPTLRWHDNSIEDNPPNPLEWQSLGAVAWSSGTGRRSFRGIKYWGRFAEWH